MMFCGENCIHLSLTEEEQDKQTEKNIISANSQEKDYFIGNITHA